MTTSLESSFRKSKIPPALRWEIWERDNYTCRSCGARRNLSIDHIIPEIQGGLTTLENLQTLCRFCNGRKGPNRFKQLSLPKAHSPRLHNFPKQPGEALIKWYQRGKNSTTERKENWGTKMAKPRYIRILAMVDQGATIKDIVLAEGVKRGMAYHLVKMTRLYKERGWL